MQGGGREKFQGRVSLERSIGGVEIGDVSNCVWIVGAAGLIFAVSLGFSRPWDLECRLRGS